MKEEDLEIKYRNEIEELKAFTKNLEKARNDYKKDIEKSLDSFKQIEGHFRYYPFNKINDEELKYNIAEILGQLGNAYKTLSLFYEEIIDNKIKLNQISLWIGIFLDEFKKLGGMEGFKKKFRDFEKQIVTKDQYKEDLKIVHNINKFMKDIEKKQKESERYRGEEFA